MQGTDVMKIQAVLKKTGYYPYTVDKVFGQKMENAIKKFQTDFGLEADGIVGPKTYAALENYIRGYSTYTIKPGDTLYKIAESFFTTPTLILTANPGLNADNLVVGTTITVPFGFNVVDTNIAYTYDILKQDIESLKVRYPFLQVTTIGNSVLGKNLYCIRLGNGEREVFYNGAHHSLEWITTPLLMKFIEEFSKAYAEGKTLSRGYNVQGIWNTATIYIVPMVNPDGVDLVLNGLSEDNPYYSDLISWNRGSSDFSQNWQANIRGVDLNHNYNAAWEESKEAEAALGITGPGPTRYSGPSPESEPESRAIADFTRSKNFRLVLAYHTQGKVIYWDFLNLAPPEALTIGNALSRASGYLLDETQGIASYAGYKDWFIKDYRRPGYTVEAGLGKNPLPISQFDTIYNDNLELLLLSSII